MSNVIKVNTNVDHVDIDTQLIEKIINRAKKPRVILSNWYHDVDCLFGDVINHPRLGDTFIRTSRVIFLDESAGIAETHNTLYELVNRRK